MPANLLLQGLDIGAFTRFRRIRADREIFPVADERGGKPGVIVGKLLPELVAVQKAALHLQGVDKVSPCLAFTEIAVRKGTQAAFPGLWREQLVTDVLKRPLSAL